MLLRAATLLAFERDGHVTTRGILPQAAVERAIPAIDAAYESQLAAVLAQKLRVILGDDEAERLKGAPLKVLQQRVAALPEGSVPFLQGFNLWRTCPAVASLAASDELAGAAAELLGVPRVRLFQDSLFVKRPNDADALAQRLGDGAARHEPLCHLLAAPPARAARGRGRHGPDLCERLAPRRRLALLAWRPIRGGRLLGARLLGERLAALGRGRRHLASRLDSPLRGAQLFAAPSPRPCPLLFRRWRYKTWGAAHGAAAASAAPQAAHGGRRVARRVAARCASRQAGAACTPPTRVGRRHRRRATHHCDGANAQANDAAEGEATEAEAEAATTRSRSRSNARCWRCSAAALSSLEARVKSD